MTTVETVRPFSGSMSRRRFLGGLIGGAALVLAACGEAAGPAGAPVGSAAAAGKAGGSLVVAASTEAGTLDANNTTDANSRRAAEQVVETLMREAGDGSGYVP